VENNGYYDSATAKELMESDFYGHIWSKKLHVSSRQTGKTFANACYGSSIGTSRDMIEKACYKDFQDKIKDRMS